MLVWLTSFICVNHHAITLVHNQLNSIILDCAHFTNVFVIICIQNLKWKSCPMNN